MTRQKTVNIGYFELGIGLDLFFLCAFVYTSMITSFWIDGYGPQRGYPN